MAADISAVLSSSLIAAAIFDHLSYEGKKALRLCCRLTKEVIDNHVQELTLLHENFTHDARLVCWPFSPAWRFRKVKAYHVDALGEHDTSEAILSLPSKQFDSVTDLVFEFTDLLPAVGRALSQKFPHLRTFEAHGSEIHFLPHGPNLASIALKDCSQMAKVAPHVATCAAQLESLRLLGNTPGSGTAFALDHMTRLTNLHLGDPPVRDTQPFFFTDGLICSLAALTQLQSFNAMRLWELEQPDNQRLLAEYVFHAWPKLKELSLPVISSTLAPALEHLTSLTSLNTHSLELPAGSKSTLDLRGLKQLSLADSERPEMYGLGVPVADFSRVLLSADCCVKELRVAVTNMDQAMQAQQLAAARSSGASLLKACQLLCFQTHYAQAGVGAEAAKQYISALGPDWAKPLTIQEFECTAEVLEAVPPGIPELHLRKCRVQPEALQALMHCTQLQRLQFSRCKGLDILGLTLFLGHASGQRKASGGAVLHVHLHKCLLNKPMLGQLQALLGMSRNAAVKLTVSYR